MGFIFNVKQKELLNREAPFFDSNSEKITIYNPKKPYWNMQFSTSSCLPLHERSKELPAVMCLNPWKIDYISI